MNDRERERSEDRRYRERRVNSFNLPPFKYLLKTCPVRVSDLHNPLILTACQRAPRGTFSTPTRHLPHCWLKGLTRVSAVYLLTTEKALTGPIISRLFTKAYLSKASKLAPVNRLFYSVSVLFSSAITDPHVLI